MPTVHNPGYEKNGEDNPFKSPNVLKNPLNPSAIKLAAPLATFEIALPNSNFCKLSQALLQFGSRNTDFIWSNALILEPFFVVPGNISRLIASAINFTFAASSLDLGVIENV